MKQRRPGHALVRARRQPSHRLPLLERDAVVGGHHHQRAVVHPELLEPVEDPTEQSIRRLELEEVAHAAPCAPPSRWPTSRRAHLAPPPPRSPARWGGSARAGGEAARGGSRGARARPGRSDRTNSFPVRSAWSELSVGASANETDPLERSGHAKRFHAVQASSSSPRTPVRTPTSVRSRVLAEGLRAQPGHRLGDVHVVRAAEQREEVVRVARRGLDRMGAIRMVAGEDGGHGHLRVAGDGRGVAVPGRVVGQRGEVREQLGIDASRTVEQRHLGELVHHDHDHARRRS